MKQCSLKATTGLTCWGSDVVFGEVVDVVVYNACRSKKSLSIVFIINVVAFKILQVFTRRVVPEIFLSCDPRLTVHYM